MYILAATAAIFSYVERPWTPAPVPLRGVTPEEWSKEIDEFHSDHSTLSLPGLEMQLITAISRHRSTNKRKYVLLITGYGFLLAGTIVTAIAGFLLLA